MHKYFFYRVYVFVKKLGVVDAAWTTMLIVASIVYFNIATILFTLVSPQKVIVIPVRLYGFIVAVPLLVMGYFIFIHGNGVQKIIAKYQNETKNQRVFSSVLTILYIVLSLYLAHRR